MMDATISPAASAPVRKPRSLAPKEHGAYGQLFVPMAASLFAARPTVSSLALAAAATAVFFAHEPVLLLLGQRGVRARNEAGDRARRRLVQLTLVALATGLPGLATAPNDALGFAAISIALGGLVAFLVWRKLEKSLAGELVAATTLASVAVPIGLAAGLSRAEMLVEWGVWAVLFSTATFAVHAVIARTRKRPWRALEAGSLLIPLGALGAAFAFMPVAVGIALLPSAALAAVLTFSRPHARTLRTLGWGTMGACVATLAVLVLGVR